jgi:hypothetical protein
MSDCFLTTNKARPYFLKLTKLALRENGFSPKIIKKPMLERYYECERQAKTPIYIVCDDDCIPATSNTLSALISLMEANPDYGQLGLGWRQNMKDEENNSWIRAKGEDIWDFDQCGGIIAIRKGSLKDLGYKMEYPNYGDDKVIGRVAKELGYKVGVAHKLFFHHLGHGNEFTTFKI